MYSTFTACNGTQLINQPAWNVKRKEKGKKKKEIRKRKRREKWSKSHRSSFICRYISKYTHNTIELVSLAQNINN